MPSRRSFAFPVIGAACASLACGSASVPSERVAARQADPRCPAALAPGPRPLADIDRVLTHEARRFASHETLRGYRVAATFPLARDKAAPGMRRRGYVQVARGACGEEVARRSWVVVLDMPAAPAAAFGLEALFFARTSAGWRAWYGWLPRSFGDEDGHFPGE